MKNRKTLLGLLTVILISATSCSSDDNQSSENLKIQAKATYSGTSARAASAVSITEFQINLKNIEFELDDDFYDDDDDNYGDGFYGDDDEFKLSGPFELDLLNGVTTITTLDIPNGVYEEVEFNMQKSVNAASPLFNKSVQIKGTINDIPFVFWHDISEEFEIDYDDSNQNLTITNNSATIVFDFNLDLVLASVDLTTATDGNNDGLIEISPIDTDGNNGLANLIKNKIKDATDLYDDNDDDGNDDDDDDDNDDDGRIKSVK